MYTVPMISSRVFCISLLTTALLYGQTGESVPCWIWAGPGRHGIRSWIADAYHRSAQRYGRGGRAEASSHRLGQWRLREYREQVPLVFDGDRLAWLCDLGARTRRSAQFRGGANGESAGCRARRDGEDSEFRPAGYALGTTDRCTELDHRRKRPPSEPLLPEARHHEDRYHGPILRRRTGD
jgi:hypothetical protein